MANDRVRFSALSVVFAAATAINFWVAITGYAQRVAAVMPARAREMQRVTVNVNQTPLVTVLHLIAHQAGLIPGFDDAFIPSSVRVTLHVRDISAIDAFTQALRGTGLQASVREEGDVAIVRASGAAMTSGIIVGHVMDAVTKRRLQGVTVLLDEAAHGVVTGQDGSFQFINVSAGPHRITTRLIGYGRQVKTVAVTDGQTSPLDITLSQSANTLDQVVVTGTVVQTELKAIPNAITVITAKQIEERGITHIDQLFRGDVPGLFALNQGSGQANGVINAFNQVVMFSRGATALSSTSAGTNATVRTNAIKTYVDGVEMADPTYLSQLDPLSIERIEILTGPQASTIYGSNALNGVMQIFTKRGTTSTPQLTLNLLGGWVENNFSSARTPQHDYNAQLNGIEGRMSYSAGGSWNYVGPWTPATQTTRTSVFGGTKLELPTIWGPVRADVTLRRTGTQNRQRGSATQRRTGYAETGWYLYLINSDGIESPTTYILTGQTLGLTVGYSPTRWWSHELGIGQDAEDTETRKTARGYRYPLKGDTTLFLTQSHADRRSLRYTTTVRVSVTSAAQATVTAGADAWQNLTSSWFVNPQTLTGSLTGSTGVSRQPGHNTGGFLQTQLGLHDRLFFTYGLRAEWNPNFGAAAQPNYAPRYGMAYTQDLGIITAKLRGSYGRSTRPPGPNEVAGLKIGDEGANSYITGLIADFGNYYDLLPNPHLGPEYQQGGEGGLELYLGRLASLVVTRYNQTVDGLIESLSIDSVRSFTPNPASGSSSGILDANGYGYRYESQYLNIGSIRNQGWELQGSVNTGPLTTKGTYSWTKSRVIGVDPKVSSYYTSIGYPQYQRGATFDYLPEHTWAVGVTYARGRNTIGLNVTGTGRTRNQTNDFYLRNLTSFIRLDQNRLNVTAGSNYINFNNGYAMTDLTVSQHLNAHIEGLLQVQNLMDHYVNDATAVFATIGRQMKIGARLR